MQRYNSDDGIETAVTGDVVHGHKVTGDMVGGDKFAGDKIAGDKISGEIVITGHVTGDVIINVPVAPVITPPPSPRKPPRVPLLIGREQELDHFQQSLAKSGLAIISGMAGVGKTMLAASLIKRLVASNLVFWHTFHEGEGVDVLVWRLAGFLAWHGQEEMWRMLQTAKVTKGKLPPPDMLFDYLIHQLREQPYLFCLDDFQFAEEDPLLNQLVERLGPLIRDGQIKIIITSRKTPDFVRRSSVKELKGLNTKAVHHLLEANDVHLEAELAKRLHEYTGGNAQLLTLAIDLLLDTSNPKNLIQNLGETEDVADFLMDEIEDRLNRNERLVMKAIAILQGHSGSRGMIEAILDGRSARRVLRDLSTRYLITIANGEDGKLYGQHAIVREFFYEEIKNRERRQMHSRAAEYYQDEELDLLLAARHYLEAGDQKQAVELVTTNTHAFVNSGQASQLNQLLTRFQSDKLNSLQWISINIADGQVNSFLGNIPTAQNQYQLAFSLLADVPPTKETNELKARACLGLGELFEYKEPKQALDWINVGLLESENLLVKTQASLLIMRGTIQIHLGEYKIAQQDVEQGLHLLDINDSSERCQALNSLSGICYHLGLTTQGIVYGQEALAISRGNYDLFQEANILGNLAIHKHTSGEWTDAITTFQTALEIVKKIGYKLDIAGFQLNLGAAYINTGEYAQARIHLLEANKVANDIEDGVTCMFSYYRLAEIDVRQQNLDSAEKHLLLAQQLADNLGATDMLPAIYSLFTEVSLEQDKSDQAQTYANKAYESALTLDDPFELGIALRACGLIAKDAGAYDEAITHFQKSLALLENLEQYEAARTQVELGKLLFFINKVEDGSRYLEKAQHIFDSLGAIRESVIVKELLS